MTFPLPWLDLAHLPAPGALTVAALALVAAYTIFTLVGFGSAMVAAGPLAAVMPVARVIPLLALLDCAGATGRGWRQRHRIDRGQLLRLLPTMALGQALGILLLGRLPAELLAAALGLFILSYGAWGLVQPAPALLLLRWGGLCGLVGGVFGGLFGSGGFLYAAYLSRQPLERDTFRATQAVLMAASTGLRVLLCALAGLIDPALLLLALLAVPPLLLGSWLGHHLDLRLSKERFMRLLNGTLAAAGLGLLARAALA
ncbi:MAG TPA: TSUP family transporter [Azospira sp.]|nr:TSUP family transporter [Azospira sp.]